MSRTAIFAGEDGLARGPHLPRHDEVKAQLRAILASPAFLGSRRCHQFLEYVCEKSMAGEEGALKERVIAIEVFGRQPDSAAHGDDTIVRVGAREVRKRLAQYYVTPEGAAAPVVIHLPTGSYAPDFQYAVPEHALPTAPPVMEAGPVLPVRVAPEKTAVKWWRRLPARPLGIGLVAASVICLLGVAGAVLLRVDRTPFGRFWRPVFDSPSPLLIGVGHPIVYQPSYRAARLNAQRKGPRAGVVPTIEKIDLPPEELDGSDMIPVMNQYVGFGDMIAADGISRLLAKRSHGVRILLATSIPFADLLKAPAYLIGSLSNHWTMELSQNWRYQFAWTPEHVPVIQDTLPGSGRQWSIAARDDAAITEDYAMICRVRSSHTGALLLVAAGIKQFGTEAAGRLMAEPTELGALLDRLPTGWEDKSLQIVLHMKVIGNSPAQPTVVASHVW